MYRGVNLLIKIPTKNGAIKTIKLLRSVLMLVAGLCLTAATAWAQTGTIEGQVTDQQTGEALINANVFIPSITRGAATNVSGEFTIENVPYGTYEVRVSYVGYQTKTVTVTVDEATESVDITLQPATGQLDELIVTALGTQTRINELSYSAEKVDVEDIVESGTSDLMQSLSGKVAGLRINSRNGMGGSTDIILRGINSITGDNQPLIVVDGVPYSNSRFNTDAAEQGFSGYDFGSTALDINPATIASITVLKGAAATALYGSRASNGAIIITTKQGAPQGEQVTVNFRSSVGLSFANPNTFPTYQREYGAGYFPTFLTIDNPWSSDTSKITAARYPADASFGPKFDPDKMVYQWGAFYPGHPNYQEATPWLPAENMPIDFFKTGVNVSNSLNIRGGINDGTGYYALGYTQGNITGIMPNSQLDKYKLSFGAAYNIDPKLRVEASIDYSRTEGLGRPKRGYSTIMSSFRQWWQTNVNILNQKQAYFRNRNNSTWNLTAPRTGPFYWDNPYWERYENYETDTRDRYVGYVEAQYDATEWLSITGRMSLDAYNSLIELRTNVGSVGVSDYTRRGRDFRAYNFRLSANFNKQLNESFELRGQVGALARRTHTVSIDASTLGGLVTPGLYSLDNSVSPILFPEEKDIKTGLNAIYASARLGYNNFLGLRGTIRRDKSSTLPKDNNVYFYPSISGGFQFSQLIDASWLSFGKIRAAWARVGAPADPLSLRDVYIRETNFGEAKQFTLPSQKNNADLKPMITESWEVGLQLGFFSGRLYFDAAYYNGSTFNQIFNVNISNATGFQSKFINAGQVDNTGFEISARIRPIITNVFSWTINANWYTNNSTVVELTEGINYFEMASPQGAVSIGAAVGDPIGVIRGTAFVIDPQTGKPIVNQETGFYEISESANEVIGNMLPDWNAGISNVFSYKNFTLNVLVDIRSGGDIFSLDQWYGQGTGLYPITAGTNALGNPVRDPVAEGGGIILPGVTVSGEPNQTRAEVGYGGALGYYNSPAEAYLYDGSYVKLREVGLTYSLPVEFLNSIGAIDRASISIIGRNLWIIHKNLPYADPEASLSAGNLSGYSGGTLPESRSVSFTINLNF